MDASSRSKNNRANAPRWSRNAWVSTTDTPANAVGVIFMQSPTQGQPVRRPEYRSEAAFDSPVRHAHAVHDTSRLSQPAPQPTTIRAASTGAYAPRCYRAAAALPHAAGSVYSDARWVEDSRVGRASAPETPPKCARHR